MIEYKMKKEEAVALLAHISFFEKVKNHPGMIEFITEMKKQQLKAGQLFFREGAVGKMGYILLKGTVEVLRKSLAGDDFVVAVVKADEDKAFLPIIGERSFCTVAIRSATVRARSDVTVIKIALKQFEKLCSKYPEIGLHVYKGVCDILQERLATANKNVMALFNAYISEIRSEDASINSPEFMQYFSHLEIQD